MKQGDNYPQTFCMFKETNKTVTRLFQMLVIYPQSGKGQEKKTTKQNGVSAETRGVGEMALLAKSLHLKCWWWRSSGSFKAVQSYIIDDTNGAETHQCLEGGGGLHGLKWHILSASSPPRQTDTSSFYQWLFLLPKNEKNSDCWDALITVQLGTIRKRIIFY